MGFFLSIGDIMLKRFSFAALSVAACASVFAGSMGSSQACNHGSVTIPCDARGWEFGIQALYLKPLLGNTRTFTDTNLLNPGKNYQTINPKWGWGYHLEGAYYFSSGNDVRIDWTHYDVNTGDSPSFTGFSPLGAAPTTINQSNRFDQVNLVMGQEINFAMFKNARFYGGLQYANIHNDHTYNYQPNQLAQFFDIAGSRQSNNADFNGLGPVIGLDLNYGLTSALSITADGNASLLYGTARNNVGFSLLPIRDVVSNAYGSQKAVVPGVSGKLGLNYAYAMSQGLLNLSGGYQVVNYFRPLTVVFPTTTSSDYALYGPYVGLSWRSNG